jgi:hypothetical protein
MRSWPRRRPLPAIPWPCRRILACAAAFRDRTRTRGPASRRCVLPWRCWSTSATAATAGASSEGVRRLHDAGMRGYLDMRQAPVIAPRASEGQESEVRNRLFARVGRPDTRCCQMRSLLRICRPAGLVCTSCRESPTRPPAGRRQAGRREARSGMGSLGATWPPSRSPPMPSASFTASRDRGRPSVRAGGGRPLCWRGRGLPHAGRHGP